MFWIKHLVSLVICILLDNVGKIIKVDFFCGLLPTILGPLPHEIECVGENNVTFSLEHVF
jgi:hypothetical protein